MNKLIKPQEVEKVSKNLKSQKKQLVLSGGCFDILHPGHIYFLDLAKKAGDKLFVLLESDEKIRKTKGANRPINNQKIRAKILTSLKSVDYIITLNGMTKDEDYDKLIVEIKPDIIALTKGDKNKEYRIKQCNMVNAKLLEISEKETASTSQIINKL